VKKVLLLCFLSSILLAQSRPLMLLKTYEDQNISGYLMSEKLDGVRAYWDGKTLYSRGGYAFAYPDWFVEKFPDFPLDGELWSKRGEFEKIQSITSKLLSHEGWSELGFHVFDVPEANGGLAQRLSVLEQFIKTNNPKYLHLIPQHVCKDKPHAQRFHDEVAKLGGEGIVLRNPNAPYEGFRTTNALKLKAHQDAECTVIAHHEGQGKYENMLGAFTCKDDLGREFRIGSGLSDEDRRNPPPIGSIITYKYNGLTVNNLPRFPVYLHVRKVH
jgi:DNA ligase-1